MILCKISYYDLRLDVSVYKTKYSLYEFIIINIIYRIVFKKNLPQHYTFRNFKRDLMSPMNSVCAISAYLSYLFIQVFENSLNLIERARRLSIFKT